MIGAATRAALGVPHRPVVVAVLVGLLGTAVALPFSPPDGGGRQWDDLVLAATAGWGAWRGWLLTGAMDSRARVPWRLLSAGAALLSLSCLLTGLESGSHPGGAGPGDAVLAVAAGVPLVTCALLATQVTRARWWALLLDALAVVVALLVVGDLVVLSPLVDPAVVGPLVTAHGLYAAVAIGLAGAACTVSTAGLARSATAVLVMVVLLGVAATAAAGVTVAPTQAWQAVADVACVLAVGAALVAVSASPLTCTVHSDPRAGVPVVNRAGLVVTVVALLTMPVAVLGTLLAGSSVSPASTAGCAVVAALVLVRNSQWIADSGRLTREIVATEDDFRGLVENSSDGVAIVDADLRLLFASPAARRLLGLPDAHDPRLLLGSLLTGADRDRLVAGLSGSDEAALHVHVSRPDGTDAELEVTHHERPGSGRRVLYLRDVTTRRRRERELERMAYHDHLTRLPNRALLFRELAAPAAPGVERCLLVLDLDGFKAVNDVAGHEAGDQLLVEVARRLRSVLRDDDLIARLGGDEFAVVVSGTLRESEEAAQRLVDALALPFRTGEWTFAIGASVGLTELRPGSGQVAFREADAAQRAAKRAGKGCVRVWADSSAAGMPAGDVAAALAAGELELRYTVAEDGTGIRAVHAVPVWVRPAAGLLPCTELWAAAGRQGHAAAVQRWLLATACRQTAALPGTLGLAVDLPAGHLCPERLVEDVTAALAAGGLPAGRLALTLTEEALLTGSAALVPALHELHALGVRICLDDFGMGQTLYSHLARIPLSSLRIDVAALGARGDTARALQVLETITATARSFGLRTVAHGVLPAATVGDALRRGAVLVRTLETADALDPAELAGLLATGPTPTLVRPGR